jgi:hypothetical protein
MALTQKLSEKRSQLKETRMERGLDRASHENEELKLKKDELKHENSVLRDEVERGQDERDRLLDLVGRMERSLEKKGSKKHRGRTLAVLGIGGLAAWAFGTQSGREKVNQAKAKVMNDPRFQDVQRTASSKVNDAMSKGADAMNKGADAMNKGAGTLDKGMDSTP